MHATRRSTDEQYAKYYLDFAREVDEFKEKADDTQTAMANATAALQKDTSPFYNSRGNVDRGYLTPPSPA